MLALLGEKARQPKKQMQRARKVFSGEEGDSANLGGSATPKFLPTLLEMCLHVLAQTGSALWSLRPDIAFTGVSA